MRLVLQNDYGRSVVLSSFSRGLLEKAIKRCQFAERGYDLFLDARHRFVKKLLADSGAVLLGR